MTFENATKELTELLSAITASGEKVSPGFLLKRPELVQALETALQALQLVSKTPKREQKNSARGKVWKTEEDEKLAAAYDQGRTVEELSQEFGRSANAVYSRLTTLGKVSNWDES